MGIALGLTGWWMYIDIPETPQAVVACVIIFNAAFGYRYGFRHAISFLLIPLKLGTNSVALPT